VVRGLVGGRGGARTQPQVSLNMVERSCYSVQSLH